MPKNIVTLLEPGSEGVKIVKKLCAEFGFGYPEFEELVQVEIDQAGKQRKRGITDQFDDILDRISEGS